MLICIYAVDGNSITYDASGNPTSYYNGYTMTWVEGRKLDTVTVNGQTYTYVYNADGQRVKKIHPDGSYIEYYVMDGTTVGESHFTATGSKTLGIRYTLDESGTVVGFTMNGVNYYFANNLQGDVLAVYNATTNEIAAQYTYDSWGNILSATGTLAQTNPFRYRGYYYDEETSFYYLQSRYYDAAIGRFINADALASTGQGVIGYNMFAYCNNSPVTNVDNYGRLGERFDELIQSFLDSIKEIIRRCIDDAETMVNNYINLSYINANQATSPVMSQDYKNTAPWAAYGSLRDNGNRKHMGIDFYPIDGTDTLYGSDGTPRDIYAMKKGVVVDYLPGFYGNTDAIVIDHGDFYALYGEISTELSIGDNVTQGQVIGKMKLSSHNTMMLHLEIFVGGFDRYSRYNQYRVDPTYVYSLPDWRV